MVAIQVTFLPTFDTQLARYLYQWKNTRIVALLSRREPLSLTVMEARVNPTKAIVLVSSQGGLGPQVHDGVDGFVADISHLDEVILSSKSPEDMKELKRKAKTILTLSDAQRDQIVANGKKLIREQYDLRNNLQTSLLKLFAE